MLQQAVQRPVEIGRCRAPASEAPAAVAISVAIRSRHSRQAAHRSGDIDLAHLIAGVGQVAGRAIDQASMTSDRSPCPPGSGHGDLDRPRPARPCERRGTHQGSRMSRRLITSSPRRTSATSRASGPWDDMNCAISGRSAGALGLKAGMRPWVGLIVDDAVAEGRPAQRAADVVAVGDGSRCPPRPRPPAPPEEPPQVIAGSQGLRVRPCSGLSVKPRSENSGVLVRPRMIAPAALRLAATGEVARRDVVLAGDDAVGVGLALPRRC